MGEQEAAPAPSRANRGGRAAAMEVEEEAEDEDDGEEDDEAERVLAHRSVEGADESAVTDPWKLREFYVKWKRYSHMHNCWDSYTTLAQVPPASVIASDAAMSGELGYIEVAWGRFGFL